MWVEGREFRRETGEVGIDLVRYDAWLLGPLRAMRDAVRRREAPNRWPPQEQWKGERTRSIIDPLREGRVGGLHVHTNLRVITTALNRAKGNSFTVD